MPLPVKPVIAGFHSTSPFYKVGLELGMTYLFVLGSEAMSDQY